MLTKVGKMQFAQISRNLVMQIAQNTRRYMCLAYVYVCVWTTQQQNIHNYIVNLLLERDSVCFCGSGRAAGIKFSSSC